MEVVAGFLGETGPRDPMRPWVMPGGSIVKSVVEDPGPSGEIAANSGVRVSDDIVCGMGSFGIGVGSGIVGIADFGLCTSGGQFVGRRLGEAISAAGGIRVLGEEGKTMDGNAINVTVAGLDSGAIGHMGGAYSAEAATTGMGWNRSELGDAMRILGGKPQQTFPTINFSGFVPYDAPGTDGDRESLDESRLGSNE
ncbi:unnamed protein product [Ilex paraguariensis]|uniref:Uncharacterized protein n=1 Tax=Ilex paraguariensis TaxID=185542 RepID=A0ABC8TCD9_9AQUA